MNDTVAVYEKETTSLKEHIETLNLKTENLQQEIDENQK